MSTQVHGTLVYCISKAKVLYSLSSLHHIFDPICIQIPYEARDVSLPLPPFSFSSNSSSSRLVRHRSPNASKTVLVKVTDASSLLTPVFIF